MENNIKYTRIDISEKDFLRMMEEIDNILKDINVPIQARPIRAIVEVGKRLKISILMAPADKAIMPNFYTNYNLATHIDQWYSNRYGERLKTYMGPGFIAVLLKGDPWRIRLPMIVGRVRIVCDPDIGKYRIVAKMQVNAPSPTINVLSFVENLQENLATTLSKENLIFLQDFFVLALDVLNNFSRVRSKPYIKEALSDLDVAVSHVFSLPPNYGASKWSTLQFVEKTLKCCLKIRNISVPHTHDLRSLSKLVMEQGVTFLDMNLIDAMNCPAGARYGECLVSLKEAIDAHHASIKFLSVISQFLQQ